MISRSPCKCRVTQRLRNSSVLYRKTKNPSEEKMVQRIISLVHVIRAFQQLRSWREQQRHKLHCRPQGYQAGPSLEIGVPVGVWSFSSPPPLLLSRAKRHLSKPILYRTADSRSIGTELYTVFYTESFPMMGHCTTALLHYPKRTKMRLGLRGALTSRYLLSFWKVKTCLRIR